jgi:hypothetical protein
MNDKYIGLKEKERGHLAQFAPAHERITGTSLSDNRLFHESPDFIC